MKIYKNMTLFLALVLFSTLSYADNDTTLDENKTLTKISDMSVIGESVDSELEIVDSEPEADDLEPEAIDPESMESDIDPDDLEAEAIEPDPYAADLEAQSIDANAKTSHLEP